MKEEFYITNKGEKLTIDELLRIEWAKANELKKTKGWKRMFSNDLDLLSFAEGFNAGMKHSIAIQNGEFKIMEKESKK